MSNEIEQFVFMLDRLPDGVLLIDSKGSIHAANSIACTLLSYSRQTLCGMSIREIESTAAWPEKAGQQNNGHVNDQPDSPVIIESEYRTADGTLLPVVLSQSDITLDGSGFTVATIRSPRGRVLSWQYQQFLGKSIENALSEIFIVNEATLQLIYVNREARRNTLYTPEELQAKRLLDLCQDISENAFYSLSANLRTEEKDRITLETEISRKNNEKYPAILSIHKSRYLSENVYVVQAIDISEKIQHKAAIEDAYAIINRSKSISIVLQNKEGLPVSSASGNIQDLLGYSIEDFLIKNIRYADIILETDRPHVLQEFEKIASGLSEQSTFDHDPYRIVTKDKKIRWVKASTYTQNKGKGDFFQGVIEDITDLKHHEEELFRSNTLLEKTFQSITDIVMLLDPDFRIIKINKAGHKLIDKPHDEIIGSFCHDFFPGSETVCNMSQEIFDSRSLMSEEVYVKSYNKYFVVSYAPIFNDEGNIIFIVHVLRDITDQKMMEERLLLSEKMTTIASLAAGVSHEINTPLSAILQSIQVIQLGLDFDRRENVSTAEQIGVEPEEVQKYIKAQEIDFFLEGMRESAINAAKIISNLLNFSRPQKGDRKKISINELIDNSFELARADYDLKKKYDIINITIERQYDAELPETVCIPMEIEQVLLNLIKNSVHALSENDPDRTPEISVRTTVENNRIVIYFNDNGPGIDKKNLAHIFDPFFTTKEVGIGTGLGLSLSYSIIHDKHSGSISVESEKGKGTTFRIELPIMQKI